VGNWQIYAERNSIFLRNAGEANEAGIKLNPNESLKGKVVWGEGESRQIWCATSGERPLALASVATSSSDGLDVAAAEFCPAADPEPAVAAADSEPRTVRHAASSEWSPDPASAATSCSSNVVAAAADDESCPAAEPTPAAAGAAGSTGEHEPGAARADAVDAVAAVQKLLDRGNRAFDRGNRAFDEPQYEMARRVFTKAATVAYNLLAPTPLLVAAVRRRAQASVLLKDYLWALRDTVYCLQVEPNNCESYDLLGVLKLASGCFKEARKAFQKAVELAPADLKPTFEQHLFRAEKVLLWSQRVPNCQRTFMAEDWSMGGIWRFCQGCPASSEAQTPRNFAMVFRSTRQPSKPTILPYVLTVPTNLLCTGTDTLGAKYPLVVYLHGAGLTDISKGNILERQLQVVAQEAPLSVFAEGDVGDPGAGDFCMGNCIGLAPCCPPNMGCLFKDLPNNERKRKIFWFKSCASNSYESWDFLQATRVKEVEHLVIELLEHALHALPVDVSRIFFVGSSCGGYAVLRLAELVPRLPAAVVSLAGYYPVGMQDEDHDVRTLVHRLKDVEFIWLLHCRLDKVCKIESPHVANLYRELDENKGVKVEWVSDSLARGSQSNYHSTYMYMLQKSMGFFHKLLARTNSKDIDMARYISERLTELLAPDPPTPPAPLPLPR
jgi:predicted esterase/tetratricopeptide (TPR) repeat protein